MDYLFETERLRLRTFRPQDAQRLYEIHSEEQVRKWIPNESYADPGEAESAVRFFADCTDRRVLPFVLAVEFRETGELIGDTGINEVEGAPNEVEIGYIIRTRSCGKGFASEAVQAMTEIARVKFRIHTISGRVMRGNVPSERVLLKNGFRFIREEFGASDDPYGNGMLVYVKTLTEEG